MLWVIFALGAALAWGVYGPAMHNGTVSLGHPMRALLCVGAAYFLLGVLVPGIVLLQEGNLGGFNTSGVSWGLLAGALGAIGAIAVIFAFRNGGVPTYVMPVVFAGAPVVNVLVTMVTHPPKTAPSPLLYLGFVLASAGAGMVLYFKPSS